MRFHYLIEQIYHRPWFATAAAWSAVHQTFTHALKRRGPFAFAASESADETEEQILKRWEISGIAIADMVNARQPLALDEEGLARIHIKGPMARGLSKLERACGATGYEQIQADLRTAAEGGARGILLKIDSGGGAVNGAPETAALVADLARQIRVVVHSADVIGSAAYYIAAGATKIVATRSAVVGSIGTLIPWVDFSAEMRAAGLMGDPITNREGDLKGIGITGSLTPAQRAWAQSEVQAMFEDFKAHVLAHRTVPAEAMRGQTLYGQAMLDANLVDEFGDEAHALALLRSLTA